MLFWLWLFLAGTARDGTVPFAYLIVPQGQGLLHSSLWHASDMESDRIDETWWTIEANVPESASGGRLQTPLQYKYNTLHLFSPFILILTRSHTSTCKSS